MNRKCESILVSCEENSTLFATQNMIRFHTKLVIMVCENEQVLF